MIERANLWNAKKDQSNNNFIRIEFTEKEYI